MRRAGETASLSSPTSRTRRLDLAFPVGEYNNAQPLNLGQNRWYGRVGFPIVWQLGPWVPGRRTTLEFIPSVWFFSDNDDFVGTTLSTDPMFQLESHLTRDFHQHFWGSFDMTWMTGGQATLHGMQGEKVNNVGLGVSLGYHINENVQLPHFRGQFSACDFLLLTAPPFEVDG